MNNNEEASGPLEPEHSDSDHPQNESHREIKVARDDKTEDNNKSIRIYY